MMVISGATSAVPARPARLLWVGPSGQADLGLARKWVGGLAEVHEARSPAEALDAVPDVFVDRSPAVVLMAVASPDAWALGDLVPLAIRWPLSPIVAVAATLADGRRRSGPPLPGVEEVAWHDLPGRLAIWLADREAGRAGTLGMPATARREERHLEVGREPRDADQPAGPLVSLAAARAVDLDGLEDLAQAANVMVHRRSRGRPPLDETAPVLVWDVGRLETDHLAWLRMLAANRPGLRIVLIESFPRPDTTLAALQAGAAAMLGRPVSAETLAGTLLWVVGPTGLPAGVARR